MTTTGNNHFGTLSLEPIPTAFVDLVAEHRPGLERFILRKLSALGHAGDALRKQFMRVTYVQEDAAELSSLVAFQYGVALNLSLIAGAADDSGPCSLDLPPVLRGVMQALGRAELSIDAAAMFLALPLHVVCSRLNITASPHVKATGCATIEA